MKKFSQIKSLKKRRTPQKNFINEINENEIYYESNEESSEVVKFFSKLFESKEMAHIYHLQVRGEEGSHAKHIALGEYYESVVSIIDDIIEIYQGQYGIIDGYEIIDTSSTKSKDSIDYFEQVADYIKYGKKCISEEDTHIHSLIDDLCCLIYKTLFKLKFNK